MPDLLDGMIGTVGIEVETELLPESLEIRGWRNTHDASCEIPVIKMGGRGYTILRTPENIDITRLLHRGERRAIGREFISGVFYDEKQLKESVDTIFRTLQQCGEKVENKRAGIHVHIGWAYDLETLKRTVKLAAWTESLLFHLGGMGYEFRGLDNNSAYCRPITKYGPPIVPSNIGNVQMTNIDSLLEADSIYSFWNRFGGLDIHNLPRRYTPQRYMAVNLASVFFHKTLEFRMFNTTLNKEYVMAIVALCRGLTRFTQSSVEFPDEENSVYKVTDSRTNHYVLDKLCAYLDLDRAVEVPLREILERSPVPTLNPVYVSSHLQDRFIQFNTEDLKLCHSYSYKQIEEFIQPGVVDIHTLDRDIDMAIRTNRRDDVLLQLDMLHRGNPVRPQRVPRIVAQDPDEDQEEEEEEMDTDDMTEEEIAEHQEIINRNNAERERVRRELRTLRIERNLAMNVGNVTATIEQLQEEPPPLGPIPRWRPDLWINDPFTTTTATGDTEN